jgi:hypothetical protein
MKQRFKPRRSGTKRQAARRIGFKDPSFTHTLNAEATLTAANGTITSVFPIGYHSLSGFAQLSTFFEFARPLKFQIRVSYTGWSGVAAFVPVNYQSDVTITATPILDGALETYPGSVRIQSGYNNTGRWTTFPFAQLGWNAQVLDSTNRTSGYLVFYNDLPTTTVAYTIQAEVRITCKFWRRNILLYTPTGPSLRKEDTDPDEDQLDKHPGISFAKLRVE